MGKMRLAILLLSCIFLLSTPLGAEAAGKITLFFSGEVRGNFEPCGCAAGPTGGLARRSGYARQFSVGALLHVDAGNYFHPLGPVSAAVNALMLESLSVLPISVLNLAPEDLFLWEELSKLDGETQIISTNLAPRGSSLPPPARYAVIEVPAEESGLSRPLKIGFLGISEVRQVKPNSGFRGKDPLQAIAEVKQQVLSQSDFLIVLADVKRPAGPLPSDHLLARIARQHPEVKAVIGTETRFLLHQPELVNNAVILSSVERGRYLGQLTFVLDREGEIEEFRPEFIELKDGVAEDSELLRKQILLSSRLNSRW